MDIATLRRALAAAPESSSLDPSLVPAGVLVLIYPKEGDYHVLLNKRSDSVEDHKGEIAFPGGRTENGDGSVLETALREAHEEMGIAPADVEVLGRLDDVATISNYAITPFVGTIPYPYVFAPNPNEVAEVLEEPIQELADPANHRVETRVYDGKLESRVAYAYDGRLVFGATARVVDNLLDCVGQANVRDE